MKVKEDSKENLPFVAREQQIVRVGRASVTMPKHQCLGRKGAPLQKSAGGGER